MPHFRCGHAAAKHWHEAAEACVAQLGTGTATLGFLYLADSFADEADAILEFFRQRTGVEHWIGSAGIGVCATGHEYFDTPALAVMLGDFDRGLFRVFAGAGGDPRDAALKSNDGVPHFAVVHANASGDDMVGTISGLAAAMSSGFLVGGLTSSRRRSVQIADGIVEQGLSGAWFADSVTVATRLTQGCSPIGPRHRITEAQHNVLIELDGRPALDVLKEDIGERLARDLRRIGGTIFAGLPIVGSDTGDYLVRNLVGIDPANGLVAIGDHVAPGASLMFCRRDGRTAREDMGRMLDSIRQGLFTTPRGGVYYSCLGRGPALFGPESSETRMIREALGDFPLVGFFCNGEISHNRLYGYTGVLTLFL
jgi:small ligand-binding sensory domain FIST